MNTQAKRETWCFTRFHEGAEIREDHHFRFAPRTEASAKNVSPLANLVPSPGPPRSVYHRGRSSHRFLPAYAGVVAPHRVWIVGPDA